MKSCTAQSTKGAELMAERRMFAKTIIDSDAFLDMPISARLLYYDLGMRADDDGFVNSPKKIMRMVGASPDDLNILAARKFIIPFDNGVVVIKHWRIHNYIRKDTYNETPYKEQKALLELDENSAYRLNINRQLQPVDEPSTDSGRDVDSGKVRVEIGKVIGNNKKACEGGSFDLFWKEYPRKVGKEAARKAFAKIKVPVETLIDAIAKQKQSDQWKRGYIPNPATWLNQGRWEDDLSSINNVKPSMAGMGTVEDRQKAHGFTPTQF